MRRLAAAILLAAAAWLPTVSSPPVVHAAVCTGWSSETTPPPTIRVLRTSGVVQTVDFKTYVKVVMPAEWPPGWPIESMRAGAVAIKQYAWYYTMHYRGLTGTGGCADVYDNNNDQVYAPESQTPAASHIQAVESTWPETLTRSGAILFTGYRPGTDVACGADADGNRLYQKSARQCALGGKTGEEILHIYYDPIVITGAPTVPGAPTTVSAVGYDSSALVSWSAPASDGGSALTGYTVTSTPDGKTCSTSGSLSCAVSGLTNGAAYTFSVTATNAVGTGAPSDPTTALVPAVVAGGTFLPLTPARLLDTRSGNGLSGRFSAGVPRSFQVAGRGGVPANATAVTGNLTVTDQTSGWAVFLGPVANH